MKRKLTYSTLFTCLIVMASLFTANHKDNDGPFSNMDEYINTAKGRQAYLNRLEMLRKRFGDHPGIFGWELWNEMNAIA